MFESIKRFQFLARGHILLLMALLSFLLFAQASDPPICVAQGNCPEPAAYGRQPYPNELVDAFDRAGTDRLGVEGPDLPQIWKGYPPSQAQLISPYVPCILLKAIGYTESTGWKQFNADYGQYGDTVISFDCGYGIMQITSGMGGGAGFEPSRVAGEPAYNIGTGALILIQKWNSLDVYIGNNNPYVVEDWYYAVWAYNGWGWVNNPNRNCPAWDPECPDAWNPFRPPFDGTQPRSWYPYQEIIWGYAAHPPGAEFWQAVPLTLPPRESITDPPPTHIDTPQPSHSSCSVTFLPDVRSTGGWMSHIVIHNNSETTTAHVNTTFLRYTGTVASQRTDDIPPSNTIFLNPPGSFDGSAVVVASEDVAVVVENRKPGEATNYNGLAPAGSLGNAGWGRAGTTIYVPGVKYELYGRTGRLYIFNPVGSTATVTPTFRAWNNGTSYTCNQLSIASQTRSLFPPTPSVCPGLQTGQLYGVKLESDQPLAVVLVEQNDGTNDRVASNNAFSAGAQTNYAPLAKSNFPDTNPNSSAIVVQNVGSGSTWVEVTYYDRNSGDTWSTSSNIDPLSTRSFWVPSTVPAGKVTSARIVSTWGPLVVTSGYETKVSGSWRMQYNGFLEGSTTIILPRIYRNFNDGSAIWTTGVQVQNLGNPTSNITIEYYRDDGFHDPSWVETPRDNQGNPKT